MSSLWPATLQSGELALRPLRYRDRSKWNGVRARNLAWLKPWEATVPLVPTRERADLPSYFEMVRALNEEGKSGRSFSFAIWKERNLIGQISLGGVIYGAMRGGHIGYWIDQSYTNRGYTTQAVEMVTDFAFKQLFLHRIEINLRPENEASRKVAEKAGYLFESERANYLHINGQWRDHVTFVKENLLIK